MTARPLTVLAVLAFLAPVAQGAVPPHDPCVLAPSTCITVPADEARTALLCLRVDLPTCVLEADTAAQVAAARLAALEARYQAQVERGDKLARLLQTTTATPEPEPSTWRLVSAVMGLALAGASGVAAGLEHDRTEVVVPFAIIGGGGLVVAIIALAGD